MMKTIKNLIKHLLPQSALKKLRPVYHGAIALWANLYFGRPSSKLIVIGVTGTAGKSTTINLLAHILNSAGHKTGFTTTANYSDGNQIYINKHGLSTPGGNMLQRQLQSMLKNGCRYAIIETTSEGLAQNRHLGINFDGALFTNISPAHIDSHGNFKNYQEAKGRLFSSLSQHRLKPFFEQKFIGVNLDDKTANFFLKLADVKKFAISIHQTVTEIPLYKPEKIVTQPHISFMLNQIEFQSPLFGEFNLYNILLAVSTAHHLGVPLAESANPVAKFERMPGRMEPVKNQKNIQILVDFACEPEPMRQALIAVQKLPHHRLVHVFGSTGGSRDVSKRFEFGALSAKAADIIIITNDDVYDTDPEIIARDIKEGIEQVPSEQRKAKQVIKILDRREAIHEALKMAKPNDIVLITGKSSEQFLVLPGNIRIAWDDATVVREELNKLTS